MQHKYQEPNTYTTRNQRPWTRHSLDEICFCLLIFSSHILNKRNQTLGNSKIEKSILLFLIPNLNPKSKSLSSATHVVIEFNTYSLRRPIQPSSSPRASR